MFSLTTVVISALIALFVGCFSGYIFSRGRSGGSRNADMEKRLIDAEEALNNYQRDVTDHFARTTELVKSLNESYRDMHEHLASSALTLSTPEISRQLLADADHQLPGNKSHTLHEQQIQAPRDWAPKRQGRKPTLSEEYGLDEQGNSTSDDSKTPEPYPAPER
ncbi:YhcB family protein [Gilvimarinus japonicus]|uniref:Z-ring associated protein G n=1 Tax=Gilvimarinus japonicus TaxID=1796469 RepID=A0ABV7HIS4_9GAMM